MNFFAKVILGCVVVLLAAAAVVVLFRSRESAKVEAVLREAAEWASRGEGEKVAALIDDRFDSADAARSEIRRQIRPGAFEQLEITDLEILGVEGDEARARVVLKVRPRDMPLAYPERFLLTLRKTDGLWKVVAAERPPRR
jgi:hypothetical protein